MWINYEDCKDDFWAAIRSNYDYIMDTNLIDTCKVKYLKILCTCIASKYKFWIIYKKKLILVS